ncbi:MAG: hypothetical protein JNN08_24085 [Bryobacterales bacterium]|nr:hypothetical protein [Bryobacterales bacterium]
MIPTVVWGVILCIAMVYTYLPGRFDAAATALSFTARIASLMSLLLVPVGLGWLASRRRERMWRRLTRVAAALVVFVAALAAISMNQLALGAVVGVGAFALLRVAGRRSRDSIERGPPIPSPLPFCLVSVPLVLGAFQGIVLPRVADWSRDRAISHSLPLITEIETFHQRRGHYPVSLRSLNADFPTGVTGIERFHYEPNAEAYNVFFIRPHIELDAMEVVLFNPREEHRFTSHELDILQYDGEQFNRRRGDRRRTRLGHSHWISIVFD